MTISAASHFAKLVIYGEPDDIWAVAIYLDDTMNDIATKVGQLIQAPIGTFRLWVRRSSGACKLPWLVLLYFYNSHFLVLPWNIDGSGNALAAFEYGYSQALLCKIDE